MVKATVASSLQKQNWQHIERDKGLASSTTEIQAIRKKFTAGIVAWIEELGKREIKEDIGNVVYLCIRILSNFLGWHRLEHDTLQKGKFCNMVFGPPFEHLRVFHYCCVVYNASSESLNELLSFFH